MAASVTLFTAPNESIANPEVPGSRMWSTALVAGDTSYPTGGYALTAANFGLTRLDFVFVINRGLSADYAVWNRSTQKLQFGVMSTGAEVASTTNVSAISFEVLAIGV